MEKVINYIGAKVKLYDFLEDVIFSKYNKNNEEYNFLDLFAGTNSVSYYVKNNTLWNIYANDLSNYSNIIFSFLYFDDNLLNKNLKLDIIKKLKYLDQLPLIKYGDVFNELSLNGKPKTIEEDRKEKLFNNQQNNSRMFFSQKVGQKIDTIKEQINLWVKIGELKKDSIEVNILLTFLLNYADRNANTTSVYGAYLKNEKKMKNEKDFLNLELIKEFEKDLKIKKKNQKNINKYKSYNLTVLDVLEQLSMNKDFNKSTKKKNIIYLDPPYSTRSYESNYHILEYIADLNFTKDQIKLNSKTAQKNRIGISKNPFNSKQETYNIFKEMIRKSLIISNNVYISYSTDGLIQQKDIEEIVKNLNDNYELKTYKKNYKRFKAVKDQKSKKQQQLNNIVNGNDKNIDLLNIKQDNKEINKILNDIKILSKQEKKSDEELENLSKLQKQIENTEKNDLYEIIWYITLKEGKINE
jgi:adenine-specific DNA-methyltransferase